MIETLAARIPSTGTMNLGGKLLLTMAGGKRLETGAKFIAQGLQTAAGVPLQCDEPADFRTFRVGLFGLDKLGNVARAVGNLERALTEIEAQSLAPAK